MTPIKINKFGGASILNAASVKKMVEIVKTFDSKSVLVLSAMGKTTNALEQLTDLWFEQNTDFWIIFSEVKNYHQTIIYELFGGVVDDFDVDFVYLEELLKTSPSLDYDYEYDKIVPLGEIISTKIIARYMQQYVTNVKWVDIRKVLKTDHIFREATVDWNLSSKLVTNEFSFDEHQLIVTQGFIGSTTSNLTTTLGREGSDYTAAALAWLLNAKSVTVWKDVPGIMNADPKWLDNTVSIANLSYSETVELSYYGAKVIHPKTLRPLQQKNIPLYVKSFVEPTIAGTTISCQETQHNIPCFIRKENQILVTVFPQDFNFIGSDNIKAIHNLLDSYRLHINLTQMSALSYSFCFDSKPEIWKELLEHLTKSFAVKYNTAAELLTIRHYTEEAIETLLNKTKIFIEQRTRKTAQFVVAAN